MKTGVFLQARLGSTRLPNKILKPIAGDIVLNWCMRALATIQADVYAVLVDYESVGKLASIIQEAGYLVCVGNAEHVLSRFALFSQFFSLDWIIRATADNPCVSAYHARGLLDEASRSNVDYARYTNLPIGTGVECVHSRALQSAYKVAVSSYDQEHVCPYIYRNPDSYTLMIKQATLPLSIDAGKLGFSVTLDTEKDLTFLRRLFSKRNRSQEGCSIELEELIQLQ